MLVCGLPVCNLLLAFGRLLDSQQVSALSGWEESATPKITLWKNSSEMQRLVSRLLMVLIFWCLFCFVFATVGVWPIVCVNFVLLVLR